MALKTIQKLTASGLLLYLCALIWLAPNVIAQETTIEVYEVKDLQKLSQLMAEKKLPLLLALSVEHCPYCQQLESDFLRPMLLSGEYKDKIIIRKLSLELDTKIIDFEGESIDSKAFAKRYQAYMTPTIIFIDHNGKEVAEKIIGISTPQFFGAYIDIEVEKALEATRKQVVSD